MDFVKVLERIGDDIAALAIILAGLVYVFIKDYQNGITLISIGSSYLFGKNVPKRQ